MTTKRWWIAGVLVVFVILLGFLMGCGTAKGVLQDLRGVVDGIEPADDESRRGGE